MSCLSNQRNKLLSLFKAGPMHGQLAQQPQFLEPVHRRVLGSLGFQEDGTEKHIVDFQSGIVVNELA